jgi:hypothetical protein
MERARSYRAERLSESALETARERARHVIVLMLENRSFDHLLGLLDHPSSDFENVRPGEFPNPYDLDDPSQAVTVTDKGDPRLETDPPHGHVSAMVQLHRRVGRFGMDGFVAAYAQKLAGKEHVPHIRWWRVALPAAAVVVPLAAAAHDLARRSVMAGWSGFAPWLLGTGLTILAGMLLLGLPALPGVRTRRLLAAWIVVTVAVGLAAEGLSRWVDRPRGVASWTVAAGTLMLLAIRSARRRMTERARVPEKNVRTASERIMWCMTPDKIPALAQLAREYAVCTRWHSSVPGATWPNRNFVHAATSDESVDIELGFYDDTTIFEALDREESRRTRKEVRPTWRIYHHDTPQVFAFDSLWRVERRARWFDAGQLLDHIARHDLPMYSFVEPCHTGSGSNSQHPGNNEGLLSDDFERGDMLIASIYNALVDQPELFEQTVFIVTYDEHGGFFDHVPPPKTVHPERLGSRRRSREMGRRLVSWFVDYRNRPFAFTQLGVRVPTVIVSPWVSEGAIDSTVYDHTSVVATIGRLWAPTATPLTRRDRFANDILHLLVDDHPVRRPPQRCAAYDHRPDVGPAPAHVGFATTDRKVDAGIHEPSGSVLQRDDFSKQLARLNHLVAGEPPPILAGTPVPASAARVPRSDHRAVGPRGGLGH